MWVAAPTPPVCAQNYALGLITDTCQLLAAFLVSPFSDTRPEEILTSTRVLNGDEDAVFTADMPSKLLYAAIDVPRTGPF